ncbi:uncharacterized protein LOC111384750 [Olea europaea var. sylvestris]|uniref:uncharacterized protein LOC111384750 n=1 Tax=Olea europaea var. sylvestris TaxID=158386 RepID=UPI000C1CDFBC|nr:uncharacterized protein LOC111384750 [Olea europaea var. sylvestris]
MAPPNLHLSHYLTYSLHTIERERLLMESSIRFFRVGFLLLSLVMTTAESRPDCYNDVCTTECTKKVGYTVNGCCSNDECFCICANTDCSEVFPPAGGKGKPELLISQV